MYLYSKLQNLKKPIRVAFVGCGKFVSMFLAQYNQLNKIFLDSIIELDIERAKKNCLNLRAYIFGRNADFFAKRLKEKVHYQKFNNMI